MKFEELKRLIEGKEELAKKPLSEVKIKKVSGIPIIEGVTTVGDLIPKEMKEEDLKPFLRETELCDYNHPKIKGWADRIEKNSKAKNKNELALAIDKEVKNKILYALKEWSLKASEIAAGYEGMCFNKTLLSMAIKRCFGIPTKMRLYLHKSPVFKFLGEYSPIFKKVSKTPHVVGVHYLDGWQEFDIHLDEELEKKLYRFIFPEEELELIGDYANPEECAISANQLPTFFRGHLVRFPISRLREKEERRRERSEEFFEKLNSEFRFLRGRV